MIETIVIIDSFGLNGGAEKVMLNTYLALKEKKQVYCYLPTNSFFSKKIDASNLYEFNSVFDIISQINIHKPTKIILNNKKSLQYLIPLKLFYPKRQFYYHSHGYFRNLLEQIVYTFFLLPFLHKTICVSNSIIKNHNALLKKNKKHLLVYNGFNFQFKSIKRDDDKYINIFFWAQLRNWKGHLFLLEVIKEIKIPNVKFNFVASVQDSESENLLKKIKNKIIEYEIQDKIIFHLNIKNHLEFIKSKADISLSCSQLKDPLPTIIIESLSMGIPVLATNIGGSEEILKDYPQMLTDIRQSEFLNKLKFLINSLETINRDELILIYEKKFMFKNFNNSIVEIIND